MVALEIWTYALRAYAATPQWASQHERSNRLLEETFRWRQEVSRQRGHAGVSERERNGTDVLEVAPVGVTGRSFGGWGLGMRGRTLLLSEEGVEENSCDQEASQSESESSVPTGNGMVCKVSMVFGDKPPSLVFHTTDR